MVNRKWIHLIGISLMLLVLAGCGKTVEEQITEGVALAATTFEAQSVQPTTEIGKINVYLPTGYKVEEGANEMNYIFSKGKDSFILFVNTIEAEDSRLHYENLINDSTLKVIEKETFEVEKAFGFTAVIEHSEEEYELVVSSGGVKMTTISANKKIDEKLTEMTEIVRSVQVQ
ncbi:hypothetical protein AAGS61_05620 [Lysinibacillus sp. KU-BSD001]